MSSEHYASAGAHHIYTSPILCIVATNAIQCGEERPKCSRCTMQNRECIYEFVEEPKWKEKTSVFSVSRQQGSLGGVSPAVSGRNTPINRSRTPNFNFQHHFEFVSESVGRQLSTAPVEPQNFDPRDAMLLEHFKTSTSADLILPQVCWTQELIEIAYEVRSTYTHYRSRQWALIYKAAQVPHACHTSCVCLPFAQTSRIICYVVEYRLSYIRKSPSAPCPIKYPYYVLWDRCRCESRRIS